MIKTSRYHFEDEELRTKHEARFGNYNQAPPGMKEVSLKEFVQGGGYGVITAPTMIEFRQLYPSSVKSKSGSALLDANLFYDQTGQSGYVLMKDYWGEEIRYFKFAWEYQHPCEVIEDSGWSMDERSSIPNRGIRDYNRSIKFERDLTPEEVADVLYWLSTDKCPGWTGIITKHPGYGQYSFRTTYDSSD